jgi:glucose-1-phosphate adenylyltransferase
MLLEGVDVGRYAKVKNAILDKHVKVMPNATVGIDQALDRKRGYIVTPKGITVVEKGTVVQ